MRKKRRHSSFIIGLLLGIGIPGLIGILAVQASTLTIPDSMVVFQSASTPSSTSTLTSIPLPSSTSTGLPLTSAPLSDNSFEQLYAFIQAPSGAVQQPYVLLTAFGSISRSDAVVINGYINSDEFVCSKFPCAVYLTGSSRFIFRAYSSNGQSSDEVIASVSISQTQGGYLVSIDSVNQYSSFTDSCAAIWGVGDLENAQWDNFVQFPYQLGTKKTYHRLAAQLILNGAVDTRDCPYGGLSSGLDWPTACGLEKANNAVIEWQNKYDDRIWLSSKNQGIPPKILKTLIGIESQFWPGNSRFYMDEFGLGQVNQLGMDVLLRSDLQFYQQACQSVFTDCSRSYLSWEPAQQRLIRGAAATMMDATCPTCAYGVDIDKAKQSVDIISKLVKANCMQVDKIVGSEIKDTTYADLWRFTLATYHGGVSCFGRAFLEVQDKGQDPTWKNVSKELTCTSAVNYVNGFMDELNSFDYYLYQPSDLVTVAAVPTIVPTRTPIPTPTVFVSNAKIVVHVYLDRNRNNTPDPGEEIDAMTVEVNTSDNKKLSQRTQNGLATFDMAGFTPGVKVDVSLPGLYRNESFTLPEQGEVSVVFKFDMPALPTNLP
ncbi:MAG: hypothetical protein QM730_19925 [Anaerolineales bacterium]